MFSNSRKDTAADHHSCSVAEILQWSCDVDSAASDKPTIECFPIPRIFRLWVLPSPSCVVHQPRMLMIHTVTHRCPGRPAIEITTQVTFDPRTGDVTVPSMAMCVTQASDTCTLLNVPVICRQSLPKGKLWCDVIRSSDSATNEPVARQTATSGDRLGQT